MQADVFDMTAAIEEFLSHINRRIRTIEAEIERLQEVRQGVAEGRGLIARPRPTSEITSNRKKIA